MSIKYENYHNIFCQLKLLSKELTVNLKQVTLENNDVCKWNFPFIKISAEILGKWLREVLIRNYMKFLNVL